MAHIPYLHIRKLIIFNLNYINERLIRCNRYLVLSSQPYFYNTIHKWNKNSPEL